MTKLRDRPSEKQHSSKRRPNQHKKYNKYKIHTIKTNRQKEKQTNTLTKVKRKVKQTDKQVLAYHFGVLSPGI